MDCIFCKIIEGSIPCNRVYEDDMVIAFHDIEPHAPVHVLIVPKRHTQSAMTLDGGDYEYLTAMFKAAKEVAKKLNVDESGFRLLLNTGADVGQTVPHIHMHLLGGKQMLDF